MGKGKGLTFTIFAALGAIAGYASYMARKDEFSSETKEKVDTVLNKVQNVATDLKRTYTAIGDKDSFKTSTKNLSNSSLKLVEKAGDLIASGASDMFKSVSKQISNVTTKYTDDDSSYFDDLDESYMKKGKKNAKKITTKKPVKKATKNSNKTKK